MGIQLNMSRLLNFIGMVFLCSGFTMAQEIPPIQNFTTNEYKAENQNWSISQGANKYIYVANNAGLLEYNGANWNLYPSPNDTFFRAVSVIGDRIYTGCFREFGFWERNAMGNLTYASLTTQLKEPLHEDEHIWNIAGFDKWILFQSLHRIYVYNTVDGTFNIIKSTTQLPKVFIVDSGIYFQKMEQGLFKIENGMPYLIADDRVVQNNTIVNIFEKDKKLLIQTQEAGFYFFDDNVLERWIFPASDKVQDVSIFSSVQLQNGNFALGTISNGVLLLDDNGAFISQLNMKNGINNNTVLSMFEDQNQNLWLGLDNGISMINMNSPFSVYNDPNGELGSVYAAVIL
jgi:AraC family chitin signaling transcriptional activator